MKLFKNINIRQNSLQVLKKYPLVLSCFFAVGILSIYLNHANNLNVESINTVVKIMLCIGLFGANALIFNALSNRYEGFTKPIHIAAIAVSALACFGYYFTLNIDSEYTLIRTGIIFFAQGLIYISAPFVMADRKTEHFFNLIVGRLIITMAMFLVTWGGISGILYALEELFLLYIPNELYLDVPTVLATTFVPMVWLFGIRYDIEPKTTKLYRLLLVYVCMSLLIAYTLVVYGYILKIVFNGFRMPSSIICNLVLWYSLVGMAVYYLSRSYSEEGYGKFFTTWYPRASVLPLVIMFISLFIRVNQYGYTINRMYMLLGGIYLALMTIYILYTQLLKKNMRFIVMPLAMALIELLSIIEPVSANTLALKSQQNELQNIVTKYTLGDDFDTSTMSDADVIRAQNIIRYIGNITENKYPRTYEYVKCLSPDESTAILEDHRYIEKEYYYDDDGWRYDSKYLDIVYFEIDDYKYVAEFHSYNYEIEIDDLKIQANTTQRDEIDAKDNYYENSETTIVTVSKDDEVIEEINLSLLYADRMLAKGTQFGVSDDDFVVEAQAGEYSFKFIIQSIDYMESNTGDVRVNHLQGYMLVK